MVDGACRACALDAHFIVAPLCCHLVNPPTSCSYAFACSPTLLFHPTAACSALHLGPFCTACLRAFLGGQVALILSWWGLQGVQSYSVACLRLRFWCDAAASGVDMLVAVLCVWL